MPSFMYGAIFVNLIMLTFTLLWVVFKAPNSILSIVFFLVLAFVTFMFTFSYPFYLWFIRKTHVKGLEKKIYRNSLRWGAFVSFVLCGVLGLRAFNLWNILNLGLFIVLCASIVPVLRKKKV